jgi:hypothetical protein
VAQQEAAPVVGADLEIVVRSVLPAVEDGYDRKPSRAKVEHMGLGLAAPAGTTVDANLHDAAVPFDRFSCKEPATRHAPFGG